MLHKRLSITIFVFNCRVMLGGELYCRAIGRPWGQAADFIVTVKFHPYYSRPGWAIDKRPGPVGASRAFKFESGWAGIEYSGPPSSVPGRPPEPSACPWPPVCPPVRPVRSCCPSWKPVFRSGSVKKNNKGNRLGHYYTYNRCCHRAGKRFKMNHRKPKNVGRLVLPSLLTPFHTSLYTHDMGHHHTTK
jgi:hypothetical protein